MSNLKSVRGLSFAPSDGGWLASYLNTVGKVCEIGVFADEATAKRAGFLWQLGYRFDVIRAEYDQPQTLQEVAARWKCATKCIRECIVIAGGVVRDPAISSATRRKSRREKRGPMTGEALRAARARMLINRQFLQNRADAGAVS